MSLKNKILNIKYIKQFYIYRRKWKKIVQSVDEVHHSARLDVCVCVCVCVHACAKEGVSLPQCVAVGGWVPGVCRRSEKQEGSGAAGSAEVS